MNKLKIFSTETQYDLAKDDFEWATVSFVEDVDEVRYMNKQEYYGKQYLTFEALEDGTFTFTKNSDSGGGMQAYLTATDFTSISYSTDNGSTWTTLTNSGIFETQNITVSNVRAGDKVLWKGISNCFTKTNGPASARCTFSSTCNYRISGNIMSLLYGDGFNTQTELPSGYTENFRLLFTYNVHLVSAQNLILPATTLAEYCYSNMFEGCTSLTTAPELPATTLAEHCYYQMFNDCTGLTTAPELPATTLANYCYQWMFTNCTLLTTAPSLPATTLENGCYSFMFYGCTSLTAAPELPATTLANYCYGAMFQGCTGLTSVPSNYLPVTTLANYCYQSMFLGCTSLTTAPELPATTLAAGCYSQMFLGCTSLTTAPELSATTLAQDCYHNMFNGCTSLTTAPELSATTLAQDCYNSMFQGCTSLTTAPVLPATTLINSCYNYMFQSCSSLNYIKAMFTTTPSTSYTYNWVNGVATTGTFVKNSSATWTTIGEHGVPSGWTVETASE